MRIGIPRGLYYYYYKDLWIEYFKQLNLEVVISKATDKEILKLGEMYSQDEMCLPLKIYMGHVAYLKDKCDYLFIPVFQNFGKNNHVCGNFKALYSLVNNYFDFEIIDCEINYLKKINLKKCLLIVGEKLGLTKQFCLDAYNEAYTIYDKNNKLNIVKNKAKLQSSLKKVLVIAHPYLMYDKYLTNNILNNLKKHFEIINANLFEEEESNLYSKQITLDLYWKFNKELIGAIPQCHNVDGIVFISAFPCGNDSLVTELAIKKISIPYLNLILDDLDSFSGIETRLESFIDIIKEGE